VTLRSVQNVIYDYNGQSLDGIVTPYFWASHLTPWLRPFR